MNYPLLRNPPHDVGDEEIIYISPNETHVRY